MKTTENKLPKQNFMWFIFKMLRKKSVCKNEAKLALIVPLEIAADCMQFQVVSAKSVRAKML